MNTPVEWLRYTPIIMLLGYLIPTTWLLVTKPLGGDHSISEHIAATRKGFFIIAFSVTAITIGMVSYLVLWLGPTYELPSTLTALAILTLVGGFGTAWSPSDIQGSTRRTHRLHVTSAFTTFFTIVGIYILFLVSVPRDVAPITYLAAECAVIIFTWLALLYFLYMPARNHFVFYETVGISTFFLPMIMMSFKI